MKRILLDWVKGNVEQVPVSLAVKRNQLALTQVKDLVGQFAMNNTNVMHTTCTEQLEMHGYLTGVKLFSDMLRSNEELKSFQTITIIIKFQGSIVKPEYWLN